MARFHELGWHFAMAIREEIDWATLPKNGKNSYVLTLKATSLLNHGKNMTSIKSFLSSFSGFTKRSEATQGRSTTQAQNAEQEATSAAPRTAASASDRKALEEKSRTDRSRTMLSCFGLKSKKKKSATADFHLKAPLTGLNALFLLQPIREGIEFDLSSTLSLAESTKDLDRGLRKLEEVSDQIGNLDIPDKTALGVMFCDLLTKVRTKRREIDTASFESESRNDPAFALERMHGKLYAVEEQMEKLADRLLPVAERLRTQVQRLRELDAAHEAVGKSNEKERLDELTNKTAMKISEIMRNPVFIPDEIENEISKIMQDPKLDLETKKSKIKMIDVSMRMVITPHEKKKERQNEIKDWSNKISAKGAYWEKKLSAQDSERTEVANKIVDLFHEAAREGIDLSNELSADEIVYLTRHGIGAAETDLNQRGLAAGHIRQARTLSSTTGKPKNVEVTDVTRREKTDPLARQIDDLLLGPQLQDRLLTPFSKLAENLDESIKRLQSGQPDSASAVLESTGEILNTLIRLDKAEISRLCRHGGTKGETAKTLIIDALDLVKTKAQTLYGTIHVIPQSLAKSRFSAEDRRLLRRAAGLLGQVQSRVSLLQPEDFGSGRSNFSSESEYWSMRSNFSAEGDAPSDLYEISEEPQDRDLYETSPERLHAPIPGIPEDRDL